MFKIGEFSNLVRVSARMLRYYEQNGLLAPAETDPFTGYRMYSAAQIPRLSHIVELRDMGFGVEEIKKILPCYGDAAFMDRILEAKKGEVEGMIAIEQHKLEKIAATRGKLQENKNMIYDVELKALPAAKVLALREKIPTYDAEGKLWHKLGKFMAEHKIACTEGGYSIYHDGEYKERDVDVEIAIPVREPVKSRDGFVYRELDAVPLAAAVRFSGPYSGYTAATEKLAGWIEQNGYVFDGLLRGQSLASPQNVHSEDDFLTELQVPVKKA